MMPSYAEIEVEGDEVVQLEGDPDLDHMAQQEQKMFKFKNSMIRLTSGLTSTWQSQKPLLS